MRALAVFALMFALVGCDGDDGEPPFVGEGGELAVPNCSYSVKTRFEAEAPRVAGTKLSTNPMPRLVHLGIVDDPKTSIVAQWRTVDETTTAGKIKYAVGAGLTSAQLTQTADAIHFGYNATGTEIYRVHQAHLCGLTAGTTYSYQVGAGDSWSPVYSFHTAPDVVANPDAEVVFGFVGDSRGGYDVWMQLAAQIQTKVPDLILFSGDAVTVGLTQYEWEEFLGDAEPLLSTTPIVLTNGNHEANAVNFFSQFSMPGDQENFGFTYGHARVFVANDSPEDPSTLDGSTPQAMDADFTANAAVKWKMLMHHRPMYSSGSRHGSNLQLRGSWGPIVDKHHLDLVLNGHEHQYEVTKPLAAGVVQTTSATGTVYVVAGGAGAELYSFVPTPEAWSEYREEGHTAAMVRVRRDTLTLEPFHPDGTVVSTGFTKTK